MLYNYVPVLNYRNVLVFYNSYFNSLFSKYLFLY